MNKAKLNAIVLICSREFEEEIVKAAESKPEKFTLASI